MDSSTSASVRAATLTSALGSSTPADTIPRGRPRYIESPQWMRPAASRAEARVSPAYPVCSCPSTVKRTGVVRSMLPGALCCAGRRWVCALT